jgi:NADH dehydrogenase
MKPGHTINVRRPADGTPVIAVVGAGFGGLEFCKTFRGPASVILIDKQNHHLFQPLLYQVAMAGLSGSDIASPIRGVLSRHKRVASHMAEVESIDVTDRTLTAGNAVIGWDYLVLAVGGATDYFGKDEWEHDAPGLKTLSDALRMRRRVLTSFELAESESDEDELQRLMTIVVVGGGPTGVELAGAMAELTRRVFRHDFRHIDTAQARVIIVEAADRILSTFPQSLSTSGQRQLEELGVEVRLGARVTDIRPDHIVLASEAGSEKIATYNVLWGAGLAAHPLTQTLGDDVERDRSGRVRVLHDLSVPGYPELFVIGDAAAVEIGGRPVPALAPAAMQMGAHVAKLIGRELKVGKRPPEQRKAFRFWDRGTMATIGRRRAVAISGPFRFSGYIAWLMWLFIHLIFLVGFRNKLVVMVQWAWQYLTYGHGARIIAEPLDDFPPE